MSTNQWAELVGQSLGCSDWFTLDQARIDAFAAATLDDQFIHVDPEAAAQTPFGGTIAHGLLVLSLIPHFLYPMLESLRSDNSMVINYGSDRVRFLTPVPSGSDIRCQAKAAALTEKGPGQHLLTLEVTIELRGTDKPALIAESLMLIMDT